MSEIRQMLNLEAVDVALPVAQQLPPQLGARLKATEVYS